MTLVDAHQPPPPHIRSLHKALQKADPASPPDGVSILSFRSPVPQSSLLDHKQCLKVAGTISRRKAQAAFARFEDRPGNCQESTDVECEGDEDIPAYTHTSVPGLTIIPSLLPPRTQITLLRRLMTRDLSSRVHKTNLDAHHCLPPCGSSFFDLPPEAVLEPLNPVVHKPLPVLQVMNKKLRWMTLGGQYDWTKKQYPEKEPGDEIPFPMDIKTLIHELFPTIMPQAAIMNIYSPGDTLAPHRDVSESSSAGLVSFSIGCSAMFMIGLDSAAKDEVLVLRINSGDVVVMNGESRWAWHSVPKVIAKTCPDWLERWPGEETVGTVWEGWMERKRINLNVRQMWD